MLVGNVEYGDAMKWYRYRQHYAWGIDKWTYVRLEVNTTKEALESLKHLADDWSDKFRRLEVESVQPKKVPLEHLEKIIKNLHRDIEAHEDGIIAAKYEIVALSKQKKHGVWRIPRRKKCASCKGTGKFKGFCELSKCHYCDGTGYVKGE